MTTAFGCHQYRQSLLAGSSGFVRLKSMHAATASFINPVHQPQLLLEGFDERVTLPNLFGAQPCQYTVRLHRATSRYWFQVLR